MPANFTPEKILSPEYGICVIIAEKFAEKGDQKDIANELIPPNLNV